ncbi:unnamed protein product [Rhizophagus irregularis]|nr:unnamed protein product [Rhizophagus irregularis]
MDRLREILGDHVDPLSNLSLEENEELLAINDIGDYWPEKLPKKNIHVIIEPPVSTSASNEVLELREKLASLQALLNKSVYVTVLTWLLHYRLRRRRWKPNKWTANIEHATLEGLKEYTVYT